MAGEGAGGVRRLQLRDTLFRRAGLRDTLFRRFDALDWETRCFDPVDLGETRRFDAPTFDLGEPRLELAWRLGGSVSTDSSRHALRPRLSDDLRDNGDDVGICCTLHSCALSPVLCAPVGLRTAVLFVQSQRTVQIAFEKKSKQKMCQKPTARDCGRNR